MSTFIDDVQRVSDQLFDIVTPEPSAVVFVALCGMVSSILLEAHRRVPMHADTAQVLETLQQLSAEVAYRYVHPATMRES